MNISFLANRPHARIDGKTNGIILLGPIKRDSTDSALETPTFVGPCSFTTTPSATVFSACRMGIVRVLFDMFAYLQRRLLYRPKRERLIRIDSQLYPAGEIQPVCVPAHDGLLLNGWYYKAIESKPTIAGDSPMELSVEQLEHNDSPLVIFFSGNARNRRHRILNCRNLAELGNDVLLVDYRGYGDNPGSPNESAIIADARSVWHYALDVLKKERRQIVLYGESLGGGVATQLAAQLSLLGTPAAGLVLNATFTSLAEAVPHYFRRIPIGWLPLQSILVDRFESNEHLPHVTSPVLVMHGQQDRQIPLHIGRKLFDLAAERSHCGRQKQFVELPHAGHNNIHVVAKREFQSALVPFFESVRQSCPIESTSLVQAEMK